MPERDLSVQVSGWMLMEAAHVVAEEAPAQEEAPAPEEEGTE